MNAPSLSTRIAIVTFVGGLGGGLVFPILPALGLQLGIPGFMIGLILSANRISRLVFNVPAGHSIARIGPRVTLSGALLVETVGMLGFSAALHFGNPAWWLLGGRALYGVGTAFLLVGAQAASLSLSDKGDRGRKTAGVRVAINTAVPAGLILGGILADVISDDAAFLAGAAITFAGAAFAAFCLPSIAAGRGEDGPAREGGGFAGLFRLERLPLLVSAWSFNFLIFLTVQGALLATLVVLVQARGIHMFGMAAQGTSGLIMAVLIGCAALTAFAMGRAIDAVRLRAVLLVPSLIGLAAGFAILALAPSLYPTLLGAVVVGLSYNGVTLPMMALLGDAVDARQHGPAVGVFQFFGDVGGTIGPIVGIEAATRLGLAPLYLALAALTGLAVVLALWLLRREALLHPEDAPARPDRT